MLIKNAVSKFEDWIFLMIGFFFIFIFIFITIPSFTNADLIPCKTLQTELGHHYTPPDPMYYQNKIFSYFFCIYLSIPDWRISITNFSFNTINTMPYVPKKSAADIHNIQNNFILSIIVTVLPTIILTPSPTHIFQYCTDFNMLGSSSLR